MKPIEAGCLALELPCEESDCAVYTVRVIRKSAPFREDLFCGACGSDPWYLCHWEVDGSAALNACEKRLIRIDGYEETEETEEAAHA